MIAYWLWLSNEAINLYPDDMVNLDICPTVWNCFRWWKIRAVTIREWLCLESKFWLGISYWYLHILITTTMNFDSDCILKLRLYIACLNFLMQCVCIIKNVYMLAVAYISWKYTNVCYSDLLKNIICHVFVEILLPYFTKFLIFSVNSSYYYTLFGCVDIILKF